MLLAQNNAGFIKIIFVSKFSMQHLRQVSSHPKKMGNLMIPVKPHQSCPFPFTAHSQTSVKWPPNDPKEFPKLVILPVKGNPNLPWISPKKNGSHFMILVSTVLGSIFSFYSPVFSLKWPNFSCSSFHLQPYAHRTSVARYAKTGERRTFAKRGQWIFWVFSNWQKKQDALCLNDGGKVCLVSI